MPRKKKDPAAPVVNTGIVAEKSKAVQVTYRDAGENILMSLKVDDTGDLTINDKTLNADQLKDLRRHISRTLNRNKATATSEPAAVETYSPAVETESVA